MASSHLETLQAAAIVIVAALGALTIGTLFLFAALEHDAHLRARNIRTRRADRRQA